MYVDLTPIVRNKYGRSYLLRMLPLADGRSAAVFPALLEDPRFSVIKRPAPQSGRQSDIRPGVPRLQRRTASLALIARLVPALIGPRSGLRRNFAGRRPTENGSKRSWPCPNPPPPSSRLEHTQRILDRTVDGLILATLPGPSVGYIMLAVARRLLRGIAEPRELEAVLRGLPHNVTTEMDLELWQLAGRDRRRMPRRGRYSWRNARRSWPPATRAGTLPAVAQEGLRDFLARYGHRAVAEIDLGMPRWSEKPDHILGMISNYLRVEDPEQAPDRQFARAVGACRGQNPRTGGADAGPEPLSGAAGGAVPAPRTAAVRTARTAEVLHRPGARRDAPAAPHRRRRTAALRRRSRTRTTSSSWTSTRCGWACAAPI